MTTIVTSSGIEGTSIKPDSPEWLAWFTSAPEGTKISFEWVDDALQSQRFTAYRRKRYWEAQKRVSGKLRNTTIKPGGITYELLKQIGDRLTAYNWASTFEYDKSGTGQIYQTSTEATLESGEDIGKLQARIAELEKLVKHYSTDRDTLANLMAERDNRHSYNMQEALTKVEQTEQQVSKLKSAIAKLERDVKAERDRADKYCLDGLKAATILHKALKLKANSGGAIKIKIKEALKLIDDI